MPKKTVETETFEAQAEPAQAVEATVPTPQTPEERITAASAEYKAEAQKLADKFNKGEMVFEDYSAQLNSVRNKAKRVKLKAEAEIKARAEAASGNQS